MRHYVPLKKLNNKYIMKPEILSNLNYELDDFYEDDIDDIFLHSYKVQKELEKNKNIDIDFYIELVYEGYSLGYDTTMTLEDIAKILELEAYSNNMIVSKEVVEKLIRYLYLTEEDINTIKYEMKPCYLFYNDKYYKKYDVISNTEYGFCTIEDLSFKDDTILLKLYIKNRTNDIQIIKLTNVSVDENEINENDIPKYCLSENKGAMLSYEFKFDFENFTGNSVFSF